jgi:hypothetical protein
LTSFSNVSILSWCDFPLTPLALGSICSWHFWIMTSHSLCWSPSLTLTKLSPLQCPSTGLQITMELRQTPQQARTWRIHSTAICTTEVNSSMEGRVRTWSTPLLQTCAEKVPYVRTLCGKTKGFVRIVTLNTYPDEAIGLHYALLCDSSRSNTHPHEQFDCTMLSLLSSPSSLLYFLHVSTLSLLYSLHLCTFFTSLLSWLLHFVQVSTFFTSLLSSLFYCLHFRTCFTPLHSHFSNLFTFALSSLLYSLHFSTFLTSALSSLLFSLTSILSSLLHFVHFSTLFTSFFTSIFSHFSTLFTPILFFTSLLSHFSNLFTSALSSLLYSLHLSTLFASLVSSLLYSLHFSTIFISFFTSRSSLLYSLHFSTFFTSLLSSFLSSLLYSLDFCTFCTSLFFSLLYSLHFYFLVSGSLDFETSIDNMWY